ncbi:MAG: hypothetical protein ACRCSQ_01945, partial [Bacteroidales bacterium]
IFIPGNKDAFMEVIYLEKGRALYVIRKSELASAGKQGAYGTYSQTTSVTSYSSFSNEASGRYNDLIINEKIEEKIDDVYFFKIDGQLEKLTTLKKIISIYPDKKETIKEFVNSNYIKVGRESDLLMLLNFCEGF